MASETSEPKTGLSDEVTNQLALLLWQNLNFQPLPSSDNLTIGVKLNGENYSLWATLIRKAIGGRGLSSHLTGTAPSPNDPSFARWEQEDECVFTWLIQNIESHLVTNVSQYPTSKALWDGLLITYGSGADSLQVFDLHKRANTIRQGSNTLEEIWNRFQSIWMAIDIKDPNPMRNPDDIRIYNQKTQEQRLFQFLLAIDDKYETVKREVLKREPLPSVEQAYGLIRREEARIQILRQDPSVIEDTSSGFGLVARSGAQRGKGGGSRRSDSKSQRSEGIQARFGEKEDKSHLRCSHCGRKKHTKETCFLLVGYPDWWNQRTQTTGDSVGKGAVAMGTLADTSDGTKTEERCSLKWLPGGTGEDAPDEGKERAEVSGIAAAHGTPRVGQSPNPNLNLTLELKAYPLGFSKKVKQVPQDSLNQQINPLVCMKDSSVQHFSDLPNPVPQNLNSSTLTPKSTWIIDCGATDTMTNDINDFITYTHPSKTQIKTASGQRIPVCGGGSIQISPHMTVPNCLYVPALSSKLLSLSHITNELNCVALIYPHFCLLQYIRTKEIIGRGTERGGLYYVDEVAQQGRSMLAHRTATRQLWLWHRRLGHPSFHYLKLLFPSLFVDQSVPLTCETCIQAKSHRTTFQPINTRVNTLFSLVHSDVWGPANVPNSYQFQYFILFIDDFSRMTWVYFLKHKSEVSDTFVHFYNLIQTQYNMKIKVLRSDNGTEYRPLNIFFRDHGIVHQTSCPYTPQQNGVAERKKQTYTRNDPGHAPGITCPEKSLA